MAWMALGGLLLVAMNALMRKMTLEMDSFEAQFLRYLFGLLVMMPLLFRDGLAAYRPKAVGGQFLRGGLHTAGLYLWFASLPKIPLADMTAIGFTIPLFIMLGAWLFFKEAMRWERWLATALGFVGVMVVVGPKLSPADGFGPGPGLYHLLMLASAPVVS